MALALACFGSLVVLAVLAAFLECGGVEWLAGILDDRQNRNDRGNLKRPSDKYVSR